MKFRVLVKMIEALLHMPDHGDKPRADMYLPDRLLALGIALAAVAVGLAVAFAVTLNVAFVIFAVVSAVLSAAAVLCWKNQTIVILDGDTFEYTTFLGKKIVYRFSEIESLRRNSDSFTLYVGGGKVHIESMAIMSDRLTDKINEAIARR